MSHARATTPTDTTRTRILHQALRRGDPQDHLLAECDRVDQRPLSASRPSPRSLPQRTSRAEVSLSHHPVAGPDRQRQGTMGHTVETSPERVRGHIRRPHPDKMITDQIRSTVYLIDPQHASNRGEDLLRPNGTLLCPVKWLGTAP